MQFIENNKNGLVYITASTVKTTHAFTTRLGGISHGVYKSLNLGENRGDKAENVCENYKILNNVLGINGDFVFSNQVHGTEIRIAQKSDRRELFSPIPYEADGLITDIPGLPLLVFTADCMPILLHDPVRCAAGAVHAGWRGTVADIAGKAVQKMCSAFGCLPENIRAAIGPGIGRCCFETGPEIPEAIFGVLGRNSDKFIKDKGSGKSMVDLAGINCTLLVQAGLMRKSIALSHECTMCNPEKYWSHRYTNGQRGSQAAVIML